MKTMATVRWLSNVPCFCFSFTSPLFSLVVSFLLLFLFFLLYLILSVLPSLCFFFFRVDYFRFDLIFIKKNNQTEIGSNRPVLVWFFREKTGFKLFWLGFFGLTLFWLGFFRFFCLGSVWFFSFRLIKPKPNWSIFSKF
jgi:hypothetical protein